jgi:hypothetical protein
MKYRALAMERLDNVDITLKRLEIAFSHRDANQINDNMERLSNAVNALRNIISSESEDLESQFTMGK